MVHQSLKQPFDPAMSNTVTVVVLHATEPHTAVDRVCRTHEVHWAGTTTTLYTSTVEAYPAHLHQAFDEYLAIGACGEITTYSKYRRPVRYLSHSYVKTISDDEMIADMCALQALAATKGRGEQKIIVNIDKATQYVRQAIPPTGDNLIPMIDDVDFIGVLDACAPIMYHHDDTFDYNEYISDLLEQVGALQQQLSCATQAFTINTKITELRQKHKAAAVLANETRVALELMQLRDSARAEANAAYEAASEANKSADLANKSASEWRAKYEALTETLSKPASVSGSARDLFF